MKKLFLFLLFAAVVSVAFKGSSFTTSSNEIIFDGNINEESTRTLWRKIYLLDSTLKENKEIVIYLNSRGGSITPVLRLLNRINYLKSKGRKFRGIIFGTCNSACGNIFAIMDYREMVKDSTYGQHLSYIPIGKKKKYNRDTQLADKHRLKYDADMFGISLFQLVKILRKDEMYLDDQEMLIAGAIDRITPIQQVHGI